MIETAWKILMSLGFTIRRQNPLSLKFALRGGAVRLDGRLPDPDIGAFIDGVCAGSTGSM